MVYPLLGMSAEARAAAAKLQQKYAKHFNLALEDVVLYDLGNEEFEVSCPSNPSLPKWTTGEIGG